VHTATRIAAGADTGTAWVAAVDLISREPERALLHLRTRITQPGTENPDIRAVVVDLMEACKYPPITTVVNTLFPTALADRAGTPDQLAARYRDMYGRIRRESPINNRGTYFGRLVDYPARDGTVDQLNRLISHLRRDAAKTGRPRAIYEATTSLPNEDDELNDSDETVPTASTDAAMELTVYAPTPDTIPMSFPCLSHLSFQRDGTRLHLLAQYRSQYLIERGYGNFLSLGQLQTFVAQHAGLQTGELTVDTGLAQLDPSVSLRLVEAHLQRINQTTLL
jgi:hypothetical protein